MSYALSMGVALALDLAIGWPKPLFDRIGHPVTWMGAAITALERQLNLGDAARQYRGGAFTVVVLVLGTAAAAWVLVLALPNGAIGAVLAGILAWPFLAARSLTEHVMAVAQPLEARDMDRARGEIAKIVGRDPAQLDEAGMARASLESLAENSSDGVIAPLFWGGLLGLPGIAAYKAINTLDSMIGHRTDRYLHFGRIAARVDDLANWVPARLTGAMLALVSGKRRAWTVMLSDARAHRSPNAGWPEAAMSGALECRLSGPRVYPEGIADEPWLNGAAPDPAPRDIRRGVGIFWRMIGLVGVVLFGSAAL